MSPVPRSLRRRPHAPPRGRDHLVPRHTTPPHPLFVESVSTGQGSRKNWETNPCVSHWNPHKMSFFLLRTYIKSSTYPQKDLGTAPGVRDVFVGEVDSREVSEFTQGQCEPLLKPRTQRVGGRSGKNRPRNKISYTNNRISQRK